MGCHGSLVAPLVPQTTEFPLGNLAICQRAYASFLSPLVESCGFVYGNHIVRIPTYVRIQTIADPTASFSGTKPRSTSTEQRVLTS
eukprot:4405195-Ditylum_brightwellii.AAC.1